MSDPLPGSPSLLGFGIVDSRIARDVFVPARPGVVTVLCGRNDSGKSTILRAIASGLEANGTGAIAYATWPKQDSRLDSALLQRLLTDSDGGLGHQDRAWLDAIEAELHWGGTVPTYQFDFSRSRRSFGAILERAWVDRNIAGVATVDNAMRDIGVAALPDAIDHSDVAQEISRTKREEPALVRELLLAASWARNALALNANARNETASNVLKGGDEELLADLFRFHELEGVENWEAVLGERLDPVAMPPSLRILLSGNVVLASLLVPTDELREAIGALRADDEKAREGAETAVADDPSISDEEESLSAFVLADLEYQAQWAELPSEPDVTIVGPALDEEAAKGWIGAELSTVAGAMSGRLESPWVEVVSEFPLVQAVLPDVAATADGIAVVASRFAASVCTSASGDAPIVTIRIRGDGELRLFVRWGDGNDVPLGDVAEGLRHWLLLALALASAVSRRVTWETTALRDERAATWIADEPDHLSGVLVILDEPERHLHPALQRQAARFVASLAHDHGAAVILATHAPPFLRIQGAEILEVVRQTPGRCETRTLDRGEVESDLDLAARLGFDRGVIGDLTNALLLVEGKHDEALLAAWFGEQLDTAGIRVVPFHGTRQLASSVWALEELVATSGLPVAVLLDSTPDSERIRRIFALPGDPRKAPQINDLADELAFKRNEALCRLLRRLGTRAQVFVHDQPDILFFLDEREFPTRKGAVYTHREAQRVIKSSRERKHGRVAEAEGPDAKGFLGKHFGIADSFFTTSGLQRAARHGNAPAGTSLNRVIDELTAWAAG